jgi:hypothetical protein
MSDAPAAHPDANWSERQLLDWAKCKWEAGELKRKMAVLDYWDAGYAIGQAHRKWVGRVGGNTGWYAEMQNRFGAYATARQLERIAETLTREEASRYHSVTDLKIAAGIIKERPREYTPTPWKTDEWHASWEPGKPAQPLPTSSNGNGKAVSGPKKSKAESQNGDGQEAEAEPKSGDDQEDRWEQAAQDAENQMMQTPAVALAGQMPTPGVPSLDKWTLNLNKLADVESALRAVLKDAEADPPDQTIHNQLLPQVEELLMVGLDLKKAFEKR